MNHYRPIGAPREMGEGEVGPRSPRNRRGAVLAVPGRDNLGEIGKYSPAVRDEEQPSDSVRQLIVHVRVLVRSSRLLLANHAPERRRVAHADLVDLPNHVTRWPSIQYRVIVSAGHNASNTCTLSGHTDAQIASAAGGRIPINQDSTPDKRHRRSDRKINESTL